jgi:hypothetical protein
MSAGEVEDVPGLPGELPPGETLLWQGRPEWRSLARHTFKVRWVAGYFAFLLAVRVGVMLTRGESDWGHFAGFVGLALACLAMLHALAWVYARSAIYSITSRRVVMRIGVAIPMTWNLPFRRIASAGVLARADGEGDIALELVAPDRIAWLHLWPHTKPGEYARARPSFRSVPKAQAVAKILADAVATWAETEKKSIMLGAEPEVQPTRVVRPTALVPAEKSA